MEVKPMTFLNLLPLSSAATLDDGCIACEGACMGCAGGCSGCQNVAKNKLDDEPI